MRAPGYFLLLIFVFVGAYYFGSLKQQRLMPASPSMGQTDELTCRYPPIAQPILNRSFVLILSQGPYYEKAMRSIAAQTYPHYRVLTLSPSEETEVTYLEALTQAIQGCQDHEIVVPLDGYGWLAHEWVLSRLNQFYADSDLWLTYGQNCHYPAYDIAFPEAIAWEVCAQNTFRSHPVCFHTPCTFYAALFKKITIEDLSYEGKFLSASIEPAYMFPMLEMAATHFCSIPEVLYISATKPSQEEELTASCEAHLRSLPAYRPLSSLFPREEL